MVSAVPATEQLILSSDVVVDTPQLIVDESIVQQNMDEMSQIAQQFGVALRPHIKTYKTPEIARRQVAAGAVGIMCAKLGEAEVFADAGIADIAVGTEIVGDSKLRRVLGLLDRTRLTVAVDSLEGATALGRAMTEAGQTLRVYVEVDTGHHRAGVPVGEQAVELCVKVAAIPGLQFAGVMTHEGHANSAPVDQTESLALEAGRSLVATADAIRAQGVTVDVVSVGSTPAANITPTVPGVTEMRPGTYVFKDRMAFRYGVYGPDRCAARIVASVMSRPSRDRAILESGSKTLTSDGIHGGYDGHGHIIGHPDATIVSLSEEHGIVVLPEGEPGFEVGERVEIIPNHICTAVNLHDSMMVVRDGRVIGEWDIAARGRVR